jgi:hypothetical protein
MLIIKWKGSAMKKLFFVILLSLLFFVSIFADVTKKTKSEVNFDGFGKFSVISEVQLLGLKKFSESESAFRGAGIKGRLVGRFFKSGLFGDITDLVEMKNYAIDHKAKSFVITDIVPLDTESQAEPDEQNLEETAYEADSDVEIIRNEFSVTETGEQKTINGFACNKYLVLWEVEWQNNSTGEKGESKLESTVWTTPHSTSMRTAEAEELAFNKAYMEKLGLDSNELASAVTGSNWTQQLAMLGGEGANAEMPDTASELAKLKGYPIIVDGAYYSSSSGGEQEKPAGGIRGGLGGLMKRGAKKVLAKKEETPKPKLTFYTEILEISINAIDAASLAIPESYTEKQ